MVLIILDMLTSDVPVKSVCAPPQISDRYEVYKSTDAFGHLRFFIRVLA